MKIGIFITAYKVENQIVDRVLSKIPPQVLKAVSKIVIIDNRSPDGTVEAARRYRKQKKMSDKMVLLRNNENYGYGGTHKVAFNYFIENKFDYAIMLHGDGQGNPDYLLQFLPYVKSDQYDFIVGSRFLESDRTGEYSAVRRFANLFFSWLQSTLSGLKLTDPGSGFIAYKMSTIKQMNYLGLPSYFYFDPSLFLMVSDRSPNIKEFPIVWGKVEQSNINIFEYGFKLLMLLIRFKILGLKLEEKRDYPYEIIK